MGSDPFFNDALTTWPGRTGRSAPVVVTWDGSVWSVGTETVGSARSALHRNGRTGARQLQYTLVGSGFKVFVRDRAPETLLRLVLRWERFTLAEEELFHLFRHQLLGLFLPGH